MGLFVSLCPSCFKKVEWFLYEPKTCSHCGAPQTKESLRNSMDVARALYDYGFLAHTVEVYLDGCDHKPKEKEFILHLISEQKKDTI